MLTVDVRKPLLLAAMCATSRTRFSNAIERALRLILRLFLRRRGEFGSAITDQGTGRRVTPPVRQGLPIPAQAVLFPTRRGACCAGDGRRSRPAPSRQRPPLPRPESLPARSLP